IDFPAALLSLGVVEQATGGVDRAETLAKRCIALYRDNALPDDLTLGETYNLLGTCLALRGYYALAIEQFRKGVACCARLGTPANAHHGNLLLNMALLHK